MPDAGLFIAGALVEVGFSVAAAGAIVSVGSSLLLSAATNALLSGVMGGGGSQQAQTSRTLREETEKPAYRFVYGLYRATGTPAPIRVKGDVGYGCYILNSRESEGEFSLFIDGRAVLLTGDPYDFSDGGGATATNEPFAGYLKVWFGLGDQTTPPFDITDEAPATVERPELFETTDGWTGNTVCWIRFQYESDSDAGERWISVPPNVQVEGKFSKVYDPRTDATAWSQDASLCTLDAALQSPVKPYQLSSIFAQQFADAATQSEALVLKKDGSTEPRYTTNGVIVWTDAELEDQMMPLYAAGAARPIRVGGMLGIAPGVYVTPEYTLTDVIGDRFEYVNSSSSGNLPTQIRTTYVSKDRNYEDAALPPHDIAGAQASDGGLATVQSLSLPMVTSDTQAQRVQSIVGLRGRREKRFNCAAPPDAINVISGSSLTISAPSPFDRWDGIYEVEKAQPIVNMNSGDELNLVVQLNVVKSGPEIYAWTPSTDEVDIIVPAYDADINGITPPGAISATSGAGVDINTGGTVIPRIRIAFDPTGSSATTSYEAEFDTGQGEGFQTGPTISVDAISGGKIFGYISDINPSYDYDIRVRAMVGSLFSDWVVVDDVSIDFEVTSVVATAGDDFINFTGTTPSGGNFYSLRAFRSVDSNVSNAVAIDFDKGELAGSTFDKNYASVEGNAFFWIAPISRTGLVGTKDGPYERLIT